MAEKHGKEREVSFVDKETARWLAEERPKDGLCLDRFHADVVMDGVSDWKQGQVVQAPSGMWYQISQTGKSCFDQCLLLQNTGKKCTLADSVAFGKPVKTVKVPSIDEWMAEAKKHKSAGKVGMYLVHNGIVRESSKAAVREGRRQETAVKAMEFDFNATKVEAAAADTYNMPGIYYIRIWLAKGVLSVGDDIMYVLVGGDIRPNVIDALQYLVGRIKNECVLEKELF